MYNICLCWQILASFNSPSQLNFFSWNQWINQRMLHRAFCVLKTVSLKHNSCLEIVRCQVMCCSKTGEKKLSCIIIVIILTLVWKSPSDISFWNICCVSETSAIAKSLGAWKLELFTLTCYWRKRTQLPISKPGTLLTWGVVEERTVFPVEVLKHLQSRGKWFF